MRTLLPFLLFFALLATVGRSQTVSGFVNDSTGAALKGVMITDVEAQTRVRTDRDGSFSIAIASDRLVTLEFSHPAYQLYTTSVILKPGEERMIRVELKDRELGLVEVRDRYAGGMERIKPIDPGTIPTPSGNFESYMVTTFLGTSSNNELSSQYSVRGGNFDENLIYVNDIEIYRPFLVRAGQQEGLSFIHSDLVQDIQFSAGGFDARYGDKMSSVLDIRYRTPDSLGGSVQASFMGANLHLEGVAMRNNRFTWLLGARYRANSYLLSSLQTKGDYNPVFADVQLLTGYRINEFWRTEMLAHYSSNDYRFVPESRETSFGTINNALKFTVYFEGQEVNSFRTFTGALALINERRDGTELKYIFSAFRSNENESFDVLGEYFIGELDNNLGSDNFGEVAFNRGIGGFLNHARNRLQVNVMNFSHRGTKKFDKHMVQWGARYQYEYVLDKLSEWQMIDSAGYSIPQQPSDEIRLAEVIKGVAQIESHRVEAYVMDSWTLLKKGDARVGDTTFASNAIWNFAYGIRANYWSYSNQVVVSPRARISYRPRLYYFHNDTLMRRNVEFRLATGLYYQPPFYRELRFFDGTLNPEIRAQRSIHVVAGSDYTFEMWNRPFKFTSEVYFKYLDNIVPYEVDNVRIRYYATNNARGYTTGLDVKMNGEFVPGVESHVKASVMQTREDLLDDYYYNYFNSDGEQIFFGFTVNDSIADSVRVEPGSIPRPTDQRFTFGMLFQDKMPGLPALKVHLSFLFGTALPYGPPGFDRYKDTLRTPAYRRVDIGFSYNFLENKQKIRAGSWLHNLESMMLSLEVFNLLGLNNTISYTWVKDVEGFQWAIPNYLTPRRINLKLSVKF
jgi:hypothetical protein